MRLKAAIVALGLLGALVAGVAASAPAALASTNSSTGMISVHSVGLQPQLKTCGRNCEQ
jgi:hypothetical protein